MRSLLLLLKTRRFWLRALIILAGIYLLVFAVNIIILALWCGIHMQTYPTDGTFQLYNPMRRMILGEIPGHDFPFFHGVGVPYLHFPLFHILGQNVFAAEVTKWFLSPFLFFTTSGIFLYAFFRDYRKTLVSLAILFAVASLWMFGSFYPSNSLISIRTTFPMLAAAALLWCTKRQLKVGPLPPLLANIIVAIPLLGLSFACGTEQGIAAIIAFLSVRAYQHFKVDKLSKVVTLATLAYEAILIGFFALVSIFLLTRGHVMDALHYALVDVTADQGWYFGGPPNLYLSWGNILTGLTYEEMLPLVLILIAGGYASYVLIKQKLRPEVNITIWFLLLYGLIVFAASSTGYFLPSAHLIPLERGVAMLAAALLVLWIFDNRELINKKKNILRNVTIGVIALFIASQTVWSLIRTVEMKPGEVISKARIARHSGDEYVLSGEWQKGFNDIMQNIPEGAKIWSTYTGVFDSTRSQLNPSKGGEDYIIHALGDKRRTAYVQQFADERPEYAITMNPSFFIYEEWLWTGNWSFYKELFTHYTIVKISDMHVLWKYNPEMKPSLNVGVTSLQRDNHWILPGNTGDKPKVYQVTIEYKASANLGVSQFDKIPRYLVQTQEGGITVCPVSLPPSKTNWIFPIIVAPGQKDMSLTGKAHGILPTSSLDITSVKYYEIPVPNSTRELFTNNTILTPEMEILKKNCNQH